MCAGETLSSDEANSESVLLRPNTWLVIAQYFKDPELLKEFMASNCATTEVTNPFIRSDSTLYLPAEGVVTFDIDNDGVAMCMDKSDLASTYVRCAPSSPRVLFSI